MAVEPADVMDPGNGFDQARLLAEVASVVHGRVPLDDKLKWVTDAACELGIPPVSTKRRRFQRPVRKKTASPL